MCKKTKCPDCKICKFSVEADTAPKRDEAMAYKPEGVVGKSEEKKPIGGIAPKLD